MNIADHARQALERIHNYFVHWYVPRSRRLRVSHRDYFLPDVYILPLQLSYSVFRRPVCNAIQTNGLSFIASLALNLSSMISATRAALCLLSYLRVRTRR